MIGFSSDEILQKNIEALSDEDSFSIIQKQTLSRKKGLTGRYEIQLFDKDMKTVHVELACSPIFSDGNQYEGSIAVVRDITKIIELRKNFQKFLIQKDTASKGVVPICANCKSIRVEKTGWIQVEDYFTNIVFSHGICPTCCDKLYPEFDFSELDTKS